MVQRDDSMVGRSDHRRTRAATLRIAIITHIIETWGPSTWRGGEGVQGTTTIIISSSSSINAYLFRTTRWVLRDIYRLINNS